MKGPIEIIPAVLPKSFDDLKEHLERLQGAAPRVQVDIVDGRYARSKTWPYRDASTFDKIVAEERGLPLWDSIDYQFDLMIEDPAAEVARYMSAGATQVVLHAASKTAKQALDLLVDRRDEMGSYSIQVGVALGAQAQPDILEPFEEQFDFVQVMGIERIGRQGEPFSPKALYLVERLRSRYKELPIQVDGGVKKEHVAPLVRAGATRLVAGSAIFGADDPVAAYKELYTIANAE